MAISDSQGGLYSAKGFGPQCIYKEKLGSRRVRAVYCEHSVSEQVEHEAISNNELLKLDVDIVLQGGS